MVVCRVDVSFPNGSLAVWMGSYLIYPCKRTFLSDFFRLSHSGCFDLCLSVCLARIHSFFSSIVACHVVSCLVHASCL